MYNLHAAVLIAFFVNVAQRICDNVHMAVGVNTAVDGNSHGFDRRINRFSGFLVNGAEDVYKRQLCASPSGFAEGL